MAVFDIAIEKGLRIDNPASTLKRSRLKRKVFYCPSSEELRNLLNEIRKGSNSRGREIADIADFMSCTGAGPAEVGVIHGKDVLFSKKLLHIRGTKRESRDRYLPMNPPLEKLLLRLQSERNGFEKDKPLFKFKTFQGALDRACAEIGIPRLTHYDLRHFFCTRALECGVSIPVLADWMGHADGGALLLKTYSHVRNKHSEQQAALFNIDT